MRALVVIVNYRTAGLVEDCLVSLQHEIDPAQDRVVVTDNASGDDSVARLGALLADRGWTSWASIVPLETNGGFAYGNNAAIRPALATDDPPRFVLLLNPDTIVRPGAIAELVRFMHEHPHVGIAGSRLEDPDGTPQRSAFRFPCLWGEVEEGVRFGPLTRLLSRYATAPPPPTAACATDWVAGASMIIRREVLDAIGLLDEAYFMYYEEVDFCRRAARAGWPCWYVPDSRVVHLVGQASGVTDIKRPLKRRPRYWFDSRRRYLLMHHGRLRKLLVDLAWVGSRLAARAMDVVRGRTHSDPPHLIGDYVRYNLLPWSVRS